MNTFYNNSNCADSIALKDVKLIGYFSLKNERTINFDSSQLRYYVEQNHDTVHLNLNRGMATTRRYRQTFLNRHIDKILLWIQKVYGQAIGPECEKKWSTPDFVCRRGTLEKIFRISNYPREDVIICAAKWKGIIYLSKFDTKITKDSKLNTKPMHPGIPYWSGRFYQYMISETPDGSGKNDKPYDQNAGFSGVFHTHLGKHTLLYCAEMHAVYSDTTLTDPLPLDELQFAEFKTYRSHRAPPYFYTFENHISHNWWSQCVLVGGGEVVCGLTDESGIVREIQTYAMKDLITMSKEYWNPAASMNFLNNFLTYIANTVVNDCDETIYKFERIRYGNIEFTEESPLSEYSFMPEWYTR